jgi:hypothetical protein
MTQLVPTVAGHTYTLSYALGARPGTGVEDNVLLASWNELPLASHTADGTGLTEAVWTTYTQSVEATAATTALTFADGGVSDTFGTLLDSVSVVDATALAACKKGGWTTLTDADQAPFRNQGGCVSFVSNGGLLTLP